MLPSPGARGATHHSATRELKEGAQKHFPLRPEELTWLCTKARVDK